MCSSLKDYVDSIDELSSVVYLTRQTSTTRALCYGMHGPKRETLSTNESGAHYTRKNATELLQPVAGKLFCVPNLVGVFIDYIVGLIEKLCCKSAMKFGNLPKRFANFF